MKTYSPVPAFIFLLNGCGEVPSAAPTGSLSAEERAQARSVPSHGDATFILPNGREYVGGFNLVVYLGEGASGDRAQIFGSAVTTGPFGSVGIEFAVPLQLVSDLAADGLDLSMELPQLPVATTFAGGLNGYARHMQLRADPDGLFVATFTVDTIEGDGVLTGDTVEVHVHGRMSGGCARIVNGGDVMTVADVMSEPVCAAVIGSF